MRMDTYLTLNFLHLKTWWIFFLGNDAKLHEPPSFYKSYINLLEDDYTNDDNEDPDYLAAINASLQDFMGFEG